MCSTQTGSGLTIIRLRLVRDEHSSLFGLFISFYEKNYNIGTRCQSYETFFSLSLMTQEQNNTDRLSLTSLSNIVLSNICR